MLKINKTWVEMLGYVFIALWVVLGFYGSYHFVTDRNREQVAELAARVEYLICLHHAQYGSEPLEVCPPMDMPPQ